jgi:HK97 gp10 family phage protein
MTAKVKIVRSNVKEVLDAMAGDRLGKAVMAAKISMSAASHTGIVYGGHQASAPGETPAVDTGLLVNSINTELVSSNANEAWSQVGTGVVYAEFLEFGTSKMKPRPYMRPAYDNNEAKIKDTIRRFAKQQIESATT